MSVDLFHLPDDLLLEDGQDGVIVANFLEHYTAVELVAHFLKVESAQTQDARSSLLHLCSSMLFCHIYTCAHL